MNAKRGKVAEVRHVKVKKKLLLLGNCSSNNIDEQMNK